MTDVLLDFGQDADRDRLVEMVHTVDIIVICNMLLTNYWSGNI